MQLFLQINLKNLEKDSFWAKVNEERLAKDDIFRGLMENFATKVPGLLESSFSTHLQLFVNFYNHIDNISC